MKAEQDFLKKNDILPKISFKDGKAHTVKLLDRKMLTIKFEDGPKEGISYKVEENGIEKSIFTSSVGLISKLVDSKNGETYTIEMKKRKTDSGYKSYFVVSQEGKEVSEPVVDEEEITKENF